MERVLMKGCEAIAEAAVRAGCRFFAGYPITPQNEVPEYLSQRLPQVGGTFIQGESEVAAINMVYGAAATGTLAMTSSSSPGISLKSEGISFMSASRVPGVIMNFQRGGPGIGNITAAQSDYFQAVKALSHGGFKCMVFAPETLQECVDTVGMAFEKSCRDRNPAIMLLDGCIGNVMEPCTLPEMKAVGETEAMKAWSLNGKAGRDRHFLSPILMEKIGDFAIENNKMYKRWDEEDVLVEELYLEDAEIVLTAYGTSARIAKSIMKRERAAGRKVGMIRPITVCPFPVKSFQSLNPEVTKLVIDIEMTVPAQMGEDVRLALNGSIPTEAVEWPGGIVPTDDDIAEGIAEILERRGLA